MTPTPVTVTPPPQDALICGPDLTKNVEAALQQVVDTYEGNSWTAAEKKQRCADIIDWTHPKKGAGAWDIDPFYRWCHVDPITKKKHSRTSWRRLESRAPFWTSFGPWSAELHRKRAIGGRLGRGIRLR